MWLRILLLVLALGAAFPSAAFAQDDNARAIELISAANKSYDDGDFRGALEQYREAYAITGDPRVLYRIGITYENLANYQRAREHLELYMLAEPNSPYAGRVKSKIENLRNLEANLQAAVRVETEPTGANVWVDTDKGRPAGVTPVRLPLGPGRHSLLIRKEGFEDVRDDIEVGSGETLQKTYDLGSGKLVQEPVADVEQPRETVAEQPQPVVDEGWMTGQPTTVRVGPSAGVSFLSWFCVAAGWALIVTATVGTQVYIADSVVGAGFLGGAALIGLGGYFLWIRDYSRELPPAATVNLRGIPNHRSVGIGLRF